MAEGAGADDDVLPGEVGAYAALVAGFTDQARPCAEVGARQTLLHHGAQLDELRAHELGDKGCLSGYSRDFAEEEGDAVPVPVPV